MPALPAKLRPDGLPVWVDKETDIEIPRAIFENWIPVHGPRAIVRALTPTEHAKVDSRAVALENALKPFGDEDRHAVRASINGLFSGFRSMRQQGDDARAVVDVTVAVLREFPAWAITQACGRIVRGDTELDRRFAPNDTELYDVVASIVKMYRDAHKTAVALLSAPIAAPLPTPTAKSRPSADEIEAKLGRPLIGRPPSGQMASVPLPGDGNHAKRIAEDLARRRARNEQANGVDA
jgi:hypothetical protein